MPALVGLAWRTASRAPWAPRVLCGYERFLQRVVSGTSLDLLHFSLHPINATRIAIAFGLLLLHASVIWSAAAIARLPSLLARTPRRLLPRLAVSAAWAAGVGAACSRPLRSVFARRTFPPRRS